MKMIISLLLAIIAVIALILMITGFHHEIDAFENGTPTSLWSKINPWFWELIVCVSVGLIIIIAVR